MDDEKNTVQGLITTHLALFPAQENEEFQHWLDRWALTNTGTPELHEIIEAARRSGVSLEEIAEIDWSSSQTLADQMAEIGEGIIASGRDMGEWLGDSTREGLESFNEWSQEHPGLSIAIMLGGAYATSRIIGKLFGDGWISKGLHFAGGAFIAGRILGLDAIKDYIYDQTGIRVDDWRVLRALQLFGNFGMRDAITEIAGGDPGATTLGDLETSEEALEELLLEFPDIIFGRENVNWSLEHMALPALQAMNPPRISRDRAYADLSNDERTLLLNYVLRHSGMIPEREENEGGLTYEEVENKDGIEQMDLIFNEISRTRELIEEKSK